jgi:AraC-like DNA-binding protein
MNMNTVFGVLQIVSALLLFIFSVFLFSIKKGSFYVRAFLATFLLSRSIMLVGFASWEFGLPWQFPDLALLPVPFLLLYCPLMYLYTWSVSHQQYSFRVWDLLHFIPAAFMLIWNLIFFHFMGYSEKLDFIKQPVYFPVVSWSIWMWLQLAIYGSLSIMELWKFRKKILNQRLSGYISHLNWVSFLIVAFLVWKVIFLTYYLSALFPGNAHVYFKIAVETGFLVYASLLLFKSLNAPEVFTEEDKAEKYRTSSLSDSEKQRIRLQIENYLQNEKPHLDPDFSLASLSAAINIPAHHLSQVFSTEFNMNFTGIVNRYRIREAARLLTSDGHRHLNILEILFESGFNSKSVFNSCFKEMTGYTPTEFRKRYSLQGFMDDDQSPDILNLN